MNKSQIFRRFSALLLISLMLFTSCSENPAVTNPVTDPLTDCSTPSGEDSVHFEPEAGDALFFSAAEAGEAAIQTLYGAFQVENGAIRTARATDGDYSVLLFNTEDIGDFVAECDYLNHRSGGILFRADGEAAGKGSSDAFCGYLAYISRSGTLGAFGLSTKEGKWGGNLFVSADPVTEQGTDLHLRVLAAGNYLVYTVSDKDSGKLLFRYEYRLGDSKEDTLSALSGKIGLRLLNDGGSSSVENFTVRRLNPVSKALTLTEGTEFFTEMTPEGAERIAVLGDIGTGYSLCVDAQSGVALLLREGGRYPAYAGRCALTLPAGEKTKIGLSFSDGVCRFYLGASDYPLFEVYFRSETAEVSASFAFDAAKSPAPPAPEKTYTNPVADGADPEVLYENGVYYLYTHASGSVKVQTSTDLVTWSAGEICYRPESTTGIQDFMSPNVFREGDLYYLLIASRTKELPQYRVRYAVASSPTGPFVMADNAPFVNNETEIGGAPFRDEDGRLYLTTVRFGGGNHIYLQEIRAENGVITPVTEAQKILSPTEYYEIDDYGKIVEGGVLLRHGGYYYMLYASGHYQGHYGEACAVSQNLFGPYERVDYNEVLSYTSAADGVGDCVFIPSPDGSELFAVYHRHKQIGNEGKTRSICVDRVVFLPAEDGGPDVLRIVGPTVTPQEAPKAP